MLNDTVKSLALAYAETLVAYHEVNEHCKTSDLHEDKMALRAAYDKMCDAQNDLYAACSN